MTISFEGQITEIGPAIAGGYAVGEIAQLYVECAIQGSRSWYDSTGPISILYSIDSLGISNQSLASLSFGWIWVTSKEWQIKKTITLCPMLNQDISGIFGLWEGAPIVLMASIESSPSEIMQEAYPILLDSRDFIIPLKGGDGGGGDGGNAIPWKQIGIGLGVATIVAIVVTIART
jgi:hypothetical protein